MMGKMTNTDEKIAGGGYGIAIQVDDSGSTEPVHINGGGDVRAQAPIDDGGDEVTVDDRGGAAQFQTDEDIDGGGAIGVPVDAGGGAVPVPADAEEAAVRVLVPADEGGGMVKADDGESDVCRDDVTVTGDESDDAARFQAEEGSNMAMDNVGGNVVQVLVAEGGALPDVIEDDSNAAKIVLEK